MPFVRSPSPPADQGRPSLRRASIGAVIGLGLIAGPAEAAAPAPVPTIWPGWTAFGNPTQTYGAVSGAEGTSLVLSDNAFAATNGQRGLVGMIEKPALKNAFDGVVLPSGRLLVVASEAVGTSDDLGHTWRTASVPRFTNVGRLRPAFVDGRRGILVDGGTPQYSIEQPLPTGVRRGPGVFATGDGGLSWRTVAEPEPPAPTTRAVNASPNGPARPRTSDPGPPPPVSRVSVTALQATPDGAYLRATTINRAGPGDEAPATTLERSDDQGASWRRLWTLPVPPGSYDPPAIRSFGVLPSGDIVAAVTDGNNTYPKTTKPVLVIDPRDGTAVSFEAPGSYPAVSCDAAGVCTVTVGDGSTPLRHATFDGQTFGPLTEPVPFADPPGDAALFHDHHLIVRASNGGWSVTRDGRRITPIPKPPATAAVEAVAQAPDGLVALFEDDTVWRLRAGRWLRLADASALDAFDVAATKRAIVVAGLRGVARIAGGRLVREIRGNRGRAVGVSDAGRELTARFNHLDVSGSAVVAWNDEAGINSGQVVRSTDDGRSWTRLRALDHVDDLQQLSANTIVASRGPDLLVSRNAGRSFRVAGHVDVVEDSAGANNFLHFRSLKEGVFSTETSRTYITRDGGRTFQALPRPGSSAARIARLTAKSVVTNGPFGTILTASRPFKGVRPTSITARITKVTRAANGRVDLTIKGHARNIPKGSDLLPLTSRPEGGPPVYQARTATSITVAADGTFEGELTVLPGRRIQIRYQGEFDDRPFRASTLSRALIAPPAPRPRSR